MALLIPEVGIVDASTTLLIPEVGLVEQAAAGGGTEEKSGSDTPTVSLTDAKDSLLASLSRTDTASVGLTDAKQALIAALSRSDTSAVAITDAVTTLLAALARTDTATVSVTDAKQALLAALARADSPTLAITDAVSAIAAALAASDTPTISLSEAASLVATTLATFAPTSDIAAGGWTASSGSDLYAMVDESSVDDADYIQSAANPADDVAELKFAASGTPAVDTHHTLRYRLKSALGSESCAVALYCGATLIKTETIDPVPADWTTYAMTLSEAEAANITDYSDLRVKLTANT